MNKVQVGKKLNHAVHGELTVTQVGDRVYSEIIDGQAQPGYQITADFDRLIDGVRWQTTKNGKRVSQLIFHSYYLPRLMPAAGG
jgi:hypothetical protein